ncbi:MAG TPA: SRPBCC family protein, partial [Acidimicrobiales bacterium]|nr:SRPBCC family protein [Acidimicrobiales bacterium]
MSTSPPDHGNEFTRTVSATARAGQETRTISLSRTFDADPEEVWDAITDPQRIPRWFLPVAGNPSGVGDHFQFEGNAGGEVLQCERPQRLAISWVFGGQTSKVEATLSRQGDATLLRLDHTVPVDDHWREFGPGAVGIGWELALS